MEVRQSLILMENGNVGDILLRQEKPFHNHVHKKTPLMVSFAKRTDENPCASYGTRDIYFQQIPYKFVKCWFSVLHTWML